MISFARSADSILDVDLAVDGTYEIEWGINGMDCADCAMKATKAVNRLPGVNNVNVSVTKGTVRFNLDLAKGKISRANSVLESLGHNPVIVWQSVSGMTPSRVANNIGIDRKVLRTTLLEVPGMINVRFEDGKIELQRIHFSSMKMKEISDALEVSESTISRVVQDKYIQTPRGTYPLKFFFASSIKNDGSGKSVAAIKMLIQKLINEEDKSHPLSDEALTSALKSENILIARRTISKYRKFLDIPSAVKRKLMGQ